MDKEIKYLIPEPEEYLKIRKGGVLNLIFTALCLEATRQIDEGFDVVSIETAAKRAFNLSKGFLAEMDRIGIDKAIEYLEYLSENSDPDDPIYNVYDNFFDPGPAARKKRNEHQEAQDKSSIRWVSLEDGNKEAEDFMLVDMLKKRFQAVAFVIASELVGAGVAEIKDIDSICREYLGWKKGPFEMMNEIGIKNTMQIVTEKLEMSHRREINFPVPRSLIEQVQMNVPWPTGK